MEGYCVLCEVLIEFFINVNTYIYVYINFCLEISMEPIIIFVLIGNFFILIMHFMR